MFSTSNQNALLGRLKGTPHNAGNHLACTPKTLHKVTATQKSGNKTGMEHPGHERNVDPIPLQYEKQQHNYFPISN
jgi:hypothetical protein